MDIGSIIGSIAGKAGEGLLSGAKGVIQSFVADPTEKAKALAELEQAKLKHDEAIAAGIIEAQKSEDAAVSDRWKADMASDNWLSKSTRPLVMLSLLGFLFIIITTDSVDGLKFDVKPSYVELMSTLLVTTVVAYFGSRGVEKWKSMSK